MKPKDPIWGFFIQTEGKTTAKCKDCKADISAKAPRLKAHREKTKTKPTVWWLCIGRTGTVSSNLCKIAQKLMCLPASSASIERVFSNFGLIQSKLRNRLGLSRASKLVLCYRFLRGSEEIDW